jgi:two-component sensor histidine kinase
VAGGVIALSGLAKPALDSAAGVYLPPYITFYPAIVIAALAGGPLIGVVSAVATLIISWWFFIPEYNSFVVADTAALLTLGIYVVTSTFLTWVAGNARLALDEAVRSEAERAHAARESVHRIKNLLAVVQALVAKISREVQTTQEYRSVLTSRLAALDVAQSVLVRTDWKDVALGELIDQSLAPFLPNPGLTIERGPDVQAPAQHVGGLCMALYELCTNAMKYGALAEGRGPATLRWRKDGENVVLEWDERTTIAPGHGESLGTHLIRAALHGERDTGVDYVLLPDRVHAVFTWRIGA